MTNPVPKTILVSPLEWGLGHTVRVVPIISRLVAQGHRVIMASDGRSLQFLRYRFPNLEWVKMPFYPVQYSGGNNFFTKLIPQIPGILRTVRQNRRQTRRLVTEYSINLIICDHRYGLHAPGVPSVFITNQLWLKAPAGFGWAEPLVYLLHRWVLRKFTEIWLPDFPGSITISGIQTHPNNIPLNAHYIGPLSRFEGMTAVKPVVAVAPEVLVLLSGPEPQRSILEEILTHHLQKKSIPSVILRGLPPEDPSALPEEELKDCVRLINHAPDAHILWYMLNAAEIICRPGNSTITDLIVIGKTALLVPTPGQTEQEYIAEHLVRQGLFSVRKQIELRDLNVEIRTQSVEC